LCVIFAGFDYVVAPSGSCVHHVRDNFDAIEQTAAVKEVRARTFEIVEFLHDILKVDAFSVGVLPASGRTAQTAAATLRSLKHAAPSELHEPVFFEADGSAVPKIQGIEFVTPSAPDECCASGAPFSVYEKSSSTKMGLTTRSAITRGAGPNTSSRPTAPA